MKEFFVPLAVLIVAGVVTPLLTPLSNEVRIGLLAVVGIVVYCWLRLRRGIRAPFIQYRVTGVGNDGRSLIAHEDGDGKPFGDGWQFHSLKDGLAYVFGPYIRTPLRKGKYAASYRLKIADLKDDDRAVVDLDVISRKWKTLGRRTLTRFDFENAGPDAYREFDVCFSTEIDEPEVEFRVISRADGSLITLDYVGLTRRWL